MLKSDSPQPETVLRFFKLKKSSPAGKLLLVKHSRPHNPEDDLVYYRLDGTWIPFSTTDRGGWEFLDDEQFGLAADYIDLLEYYWYEKGVQEDTVIAALHKNAIEWYDKTGRHGHQPEYVRNFIAGSHSFEVFFGNTDKCSISIVTRNALWVRTEDKEWNLSEHLTTRDHIRRSAVRRVAADHLERAHKLTSETDALEAEAARCTGFSFGITFPIVPTFETILLSLDDADELNWLTAEPLLELGATPVLFCNAEKEASVLAVITRSTTWVRSFGEWKSVQLQLDERWHPERVSLLSIIEAVTWWDETGSSLPPGPAPSFARGGSIAFVTTNDPCEDSNFKLDDLVMGEIDDGQGANRDCGIWIRTHIAVLDSENHMPADEGDMRPWGGEYLYPLDEDIAELAIEFWDNRRSEGSVNAIYWSDFIVWLKNNVAT